MISAGQHQIDPGPGFGEFVENVLLDFGELRPIEISAADAGLIGHDNNRDIERIGGGYRFGHAANDTDVGNPVKIIHFFDDDAVTVQKQGRPAGEISTPDPLRPGSLIPKMLIEHCCPLRHA